VNNKLNVIQRYC